jgi:hypothetical protein
LTVHAVASLFIFNEKKLTSFFYFIVCVYIIFILKAYLVYLLLPSIFIWVQANIRTKIKSRYIRVLITPFLFLTIGLSGYIVVISLSESAGKYSLDNLETTLKGFQSWHTYLAEERDQSGYSLGEMEFTTLGFIKKIPAAINVSLFRPYVWEVRNIATLLGAIEGVVLLFVTLYVLNSVRFRIFKIISNNKEILFLLSFGLPFAFIVGLSSYNFGALSRYKIPAELFYLMALVLIYKCRLIKNS